jgi:alkylation response protein AidB-like acyl-CoA dehydrogenase
MLRQQFGRPLAGFQALQHRLASLFVDIQVSKSLLQQVASSWEDEQDRRDTLLHALKSKASRVALSAAKSAVHLHGAMGYCDEHEVGRLLKHVMVLSARDGTSAEHRRAFSQSAPRLFKTPE